VIELETLLGGGDLRSIGHVPEAIALVESRPELFAELVALLEHDDPRVRMRAADAAEKLTRASSEWLPPHAAPLLTIARRASQQEVRWHVAPLLARIDWPAGERREVFDLLESFLDDRSWIVQVEAMQALADLSAGDAELTARARRVVEALLVEGSAAVRARARRLLQRLRP
jgi:HEAT repeat protein